MKNILVAYLLMFMIVAGMFIVFLYSGGAGYEYGGHAGNRKIYESYSRNTVPKPTWSEDADEMVLIHPEGGYQPYYIDKYEATISQRRAWSVAGLKPTTKLTGRDARDVCKAAGKRLCKTAEWRVACRDGRTKPFYFLNTKELARKCDWARSRGYDRSDYAGVNNSHPSCKMPKYGLHHMIGNVVEMTEGAGGKTVIVGMSYLGTHYYGAGFKNADSALRMSCEYTVMGEYPDGRHNEGMGFRCCKDAQ
ncbi:MAG: formylglycine-generating enzyme family protein [Alcanivorax sp.]